MAFPVRNRSGVGELAQGDELFLLTTRACFGNPKKDRTRIAGRARVGSGVVKLDEPLELAGRIFDRGCDLRMESIAPFRTGVELLPLVPRLDAFPNKSAWAWWLRRPVLRLSAKDARLLAGRLEGVSEAPRKAIPGYLDWIRAHPKGHPRG